MTLLPEPLPCAHPDCGQTAAAHIGFMLGHQYEEPQPERQGLERASGYPRAVDGPGCTPAALAGRQAADRVLRASGAYDDERGTEEAFQQARENGRAFRAALGTPRVMHIAPDGQLHPVEPDPLAAIRPAEVQPAAPAEATALTEETAIEKAREVWPEAEGFEVAPGGWTFRVGAGYASISSNGRVATDPQGTRGHARRWMIRD